MYRRYIYVFIIFLLSINSYSQTVVWSTPPTYNALEEYTGELYKIREGGKVGFVDITGKILVPASYDSITPFIDNLALALAYDNGKYAVTGIINQYNYGVANVADKYYVTDKYPFFSEGKLVVYDSNNVYGYLQADGSLFESCQYVRAYPFYEGRACVQIKEKEIKYLKDDGSDLITQLESATYTLLTGSSFNEKGEAYIQGTSIGKGIKRYIIDTEGRNIREAKYSGKALKNYEFRNAVSPSSPQRELPSLDNVNTFQNNGVYGFTNSNNDIVLPAQLTEATPFRGGYAKVKKNGKYGILKLQSGSFSGQLTKNVAKVKKGKAEALSYLITMPLEYANKAAVLQINKSDGTIQELSPTASANNNISYSFEPTPQNKEKEQNIHFSLWSNELLLWEDSQQITLKYEQRSPLLSAPKIENGFKTDEDGYVRADNNNKIDVYAIIENRSTDPLSITVTIDGNGVRKETKTVSIAPEASAKISTSIEAIKERKKVDVVVETSTGLKQSSAIKVKPFI